MNTLRSLLLPAALSAAVLVPLAVFAQQASPPPAAGTFGPAAPMRHHGRFGMRGMLRGVNLTQQQREQIRQIMQQFRQAHPAGSPRDPQARAQLRQQLMNVLTPQQRTQMQQNMQRMRQHRQRGEGSSWPSPSPSSSPV